MRFLYLAVVVQGRHWEGAAAFALENFGAIFGQGDGPQGRKVNIIQTTSNILNFQKRAILFLFYLAYSTFLRYFAHIGITFEEDYMKVLINKDKL